MGTGTGSITLTSGITTGSFVDASTFGGAIDISNISASGVVISMGLSGDLSAAQTHSTGAVTIDGATAVTGSATLGTIGAAGGHSVHGGR